MMARARALDLRRGRWRYILIFFIAYLHHVLAYLDEIGRKKCDVTWYPPS
jgi:hypothetical protein